MTDESRSEGAEVLLLPHIALISFFLYKWKGWGEKQTILFISFGFVPLMNSDCCRFPAFDPGEGLLTRTASHSVFLSSHFQFYINPFQISALFGPSWALFSPSNYVLNLNVDL